MSSIDLMPTSSEVVRYIAGRKIPEDRWANIFFTENINVVGEIFPKYADREFDVEPRIVFPIHDRRGAVVGIVSRALRKTSKVRYQTFKENDEVPLIYGLDRVDFGKPVVVVEGPIDSIFIDNCIAACGGDFTHVFPHLVVGRDLLAFDNTPRNMHVVRHMRAAARDGHRVVVWPDENDKKDVNDMILSGITKDELTRMMWENSATGMELNLKIAKWDKSNDNRGEGRRGFNF